MAHHFTNARTLSTLGALVLAGTMSGCSSGPTFLGGTSRSISFNNVSDSAFNVTYYVPATTPPADWHGDPEQWDGTGSFMSARTFQVDRGETVKYNVSRNTTAGTGPAVHIKLEAVRPSWDSGTTEYWLEVLTHPPVSIVATGHAQDLTISCGTGTVAVIPAHEVGRFDHRDTTATGVASAPTNEQ